ncbi:hypothethical protein (plasmid) [Ralstonia solanacearum CMR15]|nr:hypothethical protein [Ralstonia solanacearum CMR15]
MAPEANLERPLPELSEAIFGALINGKGRWRFGLARSRSGTELSLICCVTGPMALKRLFGIFDISIKDR